MKGAIKSEKVIWKQANKEASIPKTIKATTIPVYSLNKSTSFVKYSITTIRKIAGTPKSQNPSMRK